MPGVHSVFRYWFSACCCSLIQFPLYKNVPYKPAFLQPYRLLSTEVGGGFTGVIVGMFSEGDGWAGFERFSMRNL